MKISLYVFIFILLSIVWSVLGVHSQAKTIEYFKTGPLLLKSGFSRVNSHTNRAFSQDTIVKKNHKEESFSEEEEEDLIEELKQKNKRWFKQMNKPYVRYSKVKKLFDRQFKNSQGGENKTRELGVNWLKTKLFYLDKRGRVQDPPTFNPTIHQLSQLNTLPIGGTTQRDVGSWHMLGPVNSSETRMSGQGNHGGYVYLNRIDPTNPQKMFVAFVTGGLWMTSDGGASWALTDANMPDEKYQDIDVCINQPQVIYAINDSQVIKSTDGGLNWTSTTLTKINFSGTAYDIAVSSQNPNIVVARWGDKIYRTTDGGTSWTRVISGLPNYGIWDCSIHSEMLSWSTTDPNVVYLLSTSNNNKVQLYRSSDSGASFSITTTITLDPTANGQIVGWAKLLLPSNNSNVIYVAVGSGSSAYAHTAVHLYKLDNATGAILSQKINMIDGNSNKLHHGDIVMDRNDENKISYGTYGDYSYGIHYSINNGTTFLHSPPVHADIRSLDMINSKIIVGSDGESSLFTLSGSSTTNTTITNSISNHELWGFGSAFKSDIIASGNNHGPVMVAESANGFEWYNGPGADQGNTDVNPLDDRYIYSQGYSNYRFFRNGVHSLINQANMLDVGGIYSYFNSIEFYPTNYYTIITHHAGQYPTGNPDLAIYKKSLIKSIDNGNTISIVKTFSDQVFREKICLTDPKYIYVVVGLTNNNIWKTTDGGTNWVKITPSTAESSGQLNISDIAVSDTNPNEVWATYSGVQNRCKVLKTSNGGTSWINRTDNLTTKQPLTKIIFQRNTNGGVYVGCKDGVYYRNNTMTAWGKLGRDVPMMDIRFMFINYNKNKLRIGTSRGAWENDLYEISPPQAQISADVASINCPNLNVRFKDYSVVRNASAKWEWSFPGGTPSTSTEENPSVSYRDTPSGSYDVILTVNDAYGSSTQTLSKFIKVTNVDANISASGPLTFCQGGSVRLTASSASNYLWSTGARSRDIEVTSSGSYTVKTNNGSCSATSFPIQVTVISSPTTPTITANGTLLMSSAPVNNQWYLEGNIIPGATSSTYTAIKNGNYVVEVTDPSGCGITMSNNYRLNTSLLIPGEDAEFGIYPNPNSGVFEIKRSNIDLEILEIRVYNMAGKIVLKTLKPTSTTVDISSSPPDIYVLEIITNKEVYHRKVLRY